MSWFPKPRGGIGRYGNMTHSSKGYRQWQTKFLESLYNSANQFPGDFHCLIFFFYIKHKPARFRKFTRQYTRRVKKMWVYQR
jgi:hypothetical protein